VLADACRHRGRPIVHARRCAGGSSFWASRRRGGDHENTMPNSIVHLIRNSLDYVPGKTARRWLRRSIYAEPSAEAAIVALDASEDGEWGCAWLRSRRYAEGVGVGPKRIAAELGCSRNRSGTAWRGVIGSHASPSRSNALDGLSDWLRERYRWHAGNAEWCAGVTAEPARPGSVDRSVEGVERQARVAHDFTNLTMFRIVTTWLDGHAYRVTSGYIYQSIHSDIRKGNFAI
jgi:hypothetical protein